MLCSSEVVAALLEEGSMRCLVLRRLNEGVGAGHFHICLRKAVMAMVWPRELLCHQPKV